MQGSRDSLTSAVLSMHSVTVVTRGADLTVWSCRVVHATQALARQWVAVGEQHVGVRIVVATTRLTLAAQHNGVAVVARCAPAVGGNQV